MSDVGVTPSSAPNPDRPGPPQGTWRNQHGSNLTLSADGEGGLAGSYRAARGAFAGGTYPVRGSYDPRPTGASSVVAFVVEWSEAHTVTVWSGQYFSGSKTLRATWLMTVETGETDDWKSTFVGHDVFLYVSD